VLYLEKRRSGELNRGAIPHRRHEKGLVENNRGVFLLSLGTNEKRKVGGAIWVLYR